MVRTKADGGAARTVASKAPRKNLGGGGSSSAASRAIAAAAGGTGTPSKSGGGNSYNPQPTPEWQKPLTSFFTKLLSKDEEEDMEGQDEGGETENEELKEKVSVNYPCLFCQLFTPNLYG